MFMNLKTLFAFKWWKSWPILFIGVKKQNYQDPLIIDNNILPWVWRRKEWSEKEETVNLPKVYILEIRKFILGDLGFYITRELGNVNIKPICSVTENNNKQTMGNPLKIYWKLASISSIIIYLGFFTMRKRTTTARFWPWERRWMEWKLKWRKN